MFFVTRCYSWETNKEKENEKDTTVTPKIQSQSIFRFLWVARILSQELTIYKVARYSPAMVGSGALIPVEYLLESTFSR